MPKKQPDSGPLSATASPVVGVQRIPLWQALVLPVLAILVFFLLLEGGLALFGIQPASQIEDPFVGFAGNVPLFIPSTGPDGQQLLITAPNKKDYFNRQSFKQEKTPGTYRIFCLGGSTTYGRPYADSTSFAGWLRELLPVADRSRNWEVINAGGISYASYRVAGLMEELINYQPDLFIIYTGHNEFLEERTYREIRDLPPLVRATVSQLVRTRTWTAMANVLESLHISPKTEKDNRFKLGVEVDTILDRSVGPARYSRDDILRENILKHYRISLENMVRLARSVGARVIFVTPAANLKDCFPFKSQDTTGVSNADIKRSGELLAMSKPLIWDMEWQLVLGFLDEAAMLNPRYAEIHYLRGQALLALGRFDEAKKAYLRALDEDVCPLRALPPMRRIITEVATELGVRQVDFIDLIEQRMQQEQGYAIPGQEYFLDHVHPTIDSHKILAVALIKAMTDEGYVQPDPGWGDEAISAVTAKIKGNIEPETHGRALANLARVLLWAGKEDEAARLARQALDIAGQYMQVAINAASVMSTVYVIYGKPQLAEKLLYKYLEKSPNSVELRLQLGKILLDSRLRKAEEAAANLLLVTQMMPYYDMGHALFGIIMVDRGRPALAYSSLMEALRLNPNNTDARLRFTQISPQLTDQEISAPLPLIRLDYYPSTAPRRLVQGRLNSDGDFIGDGIEVVFHENGRLKSFLDIEDGQPNGVEMTWDHDGKILLRKVLASTSISKKSGK